MFTPCNTECKSIWPVIWFASVLVITLFLSCGEYFETNGIPADLVPVGSDVLLELPDTFSVRKIWSVELPGVNSLMAADLSGDDTVELICSSPQNTYILDTHGKLLSSFPLETGEIPSLTRDMDDDGKQDILFHRPLGPQAGLRVVNGMGIELSSFTPKMEGSKFAKLTVEVIDKENIYIRLNTDNVSGYRGFMKLSFPDLEPFWFFSTPFIPEQLFPIMDSSYTKVVKLFPGLKTTYTGMYEFFGKEMVPRLDLETDFSYFSITNNGNYSEPIPFEGGDSPFRGRIRYLKETENGFILLHESNYFVSHMFRIVKINKDGNITDKSGFIEGVPERWVETLDGNMVLTTYELGDEREFYSVSTEDEKSLTYGELLFPYSDLVNSFPPYTVTANVPDEFSSMTNFLFLSESSDRSQFPGYIVTADRFAVSFYRIVPDFSTNFNIDDTDFQFSNEDGKYDIAEFKDGQLHLRAVKDIGLKNAAIAEFHKKISGNSNIFFSVKFGENINSQHPLGRFKILSQDLEGGIDFLVRNDQFEYSIHENEIHNYRHLKYFSITPDQYYAIRFHLRSDTVDFYIDGNLLDSVNYTPKLPEANYFHFESHNEYWVKDFKVFLD